MQHQISSLANGLRVISVPLPHLHSVELAVYIKVGARNDPPDRSGLSHFLEHMLFRGTDDYATSLDIESAFESLGGSVNAATDTDSTSRRGGATPPVGTSCSSSTTGRPRPSASRADCGIQV